MNRWSEKSDLNPRKHLILTFTTKKGADVEATHQHFGDTESLHIWRINPSSVFTHKTPDPDQVMSSSKLPPWINKRKHMEFYLQGELSV